MVRRGLVLVILVVGVVGFGAGVARAAAPTAPTGVTATAGDRQATVHWRAPSSNGGATITGYTATASPGGATCSGTSNACVVTGLTNGTSYTFTVTATNADGTSPPSTASPAVTPAGVPGAPTHVTATAGNAQATVTWTAPGSTGGAPIKSYKVSASGTGGQTCDWSSGALSCTVGNLVNGVSYTFTVTATNSSGTGPASTASPAVTPKGAPAAPTAVSAVAGDQQATVTCTAPATNGGAAITSYTATASPGGAHASATSCSITVTGLTDGTAYTFTVTATSSLGTSAASSASGAVTPVDTHPPNPPGGIGGRIVKGVLTLFWQAAADNVGVTRYEVYLNGAPIVQVAGTATTATSRSFRPTGRSDFTVRAFDAAGNQSAASGSVVVKPTPNPKRNAPAWAWKLLAWQQHGMKGKRPASAPKKLPKWYAGWKHWRLSPFEIVS